MTQSVFITMPVKDLKTSRTFYEALGFSINEDFSGDSTFCVEISKTIYLMFGTHEQFQNLSPKPLILPSEGAMALISLSFESREKVDEVAKSAVAFGGRELHDAEDLGFMYSRAFEDPDGNGFGIFWMK